jgi:hypothetical protein
MAVDRAEKENLPPSAAPSAAAARLHGVAVKSCKLKRLGRARRRVPLRDITNLFVTEPAAAERQQALLQEPRAWPATAELAKAEPAMKSGLPAAAAGSRAGRYSLRKEFR